MIVAYFLGATLYREKAIFNLTSSSSCLVYFYGGGNGRGGFVVDVSSEKKIPGLLVAIAHHDPLHYTFNFNP